MNNDPLRPVTNEDLQRIIESRQSSGFVSMLHPIELYIRRDLLEGVTRDSLHALRTREGLTETMEELKARQRAIQQRVDFLAWLGVQEDEVYMALYPADMDGLDDLEDLQDLLNNDSGEMPF